ncbi:hypothetical protein, partial [Nocardiopsis halotolerans]|uniref:hypothetical protein n=1 Tax=Nocardiopsis halotolerans TaxID=124252 RepID=UPI0004759A99
MSSITRDTAPAVLVPGLLVAGTVLYVLPSALHGNPPVDSAADTLAYVAERPSWRVVHLVNIGAVLVWLAAFGVLARHLGGRGEALARYATHVFTA